MTDTREQAAASPSAVAEWIRGQVDPLLKKGWLTADGANELIAQARQKDILSSQAPKPASACGWRSVLCPALLYPTLRGWLDEDSAKKAAEQVACALYDAFIAAEADTAKDGAK